MEKCIGCKNYSDKSDCAVCKPNYRKTNADRIRSMNDKQLAIFLKPLIGTLTEKEIFKWLQTEAQEGNKIE